MKEYLIQFLYALPALLIALSFHEYAHAYVAYKLGDLSQKARNRLTLSPFAHIDPIGFLFMLLFRFGWGKPVMVDDTNFKNKEKGVMLVSLAGPVMNIILAFVFTLILKLVMLIFGAGLSNTSYVGGILLGMVIYAIQFNLVFAVFNLIPIPPFDGSKILYYFLPKKAKMWFLNMERYSIIILFVLMFTGLYSYIIAPLYDFLAYIIQLILLI